MKISQHRDGTITLKNITFNKLSTIIDGYHYRTCSMLEYAEENKDNDAIWSWAIEEVEDMQKDINQLLKIQEKLANK